MTTGAFFWLRSVALHCFLPLALLISRGCCAGVSVIRDPTDVSAPEGLTVTLACRTAPGANVKVIWNRDGVLVASTRLPSTDPRYSIVSSPQEGVHDLRVSGLQMKDQGQYYCQVSQVSSRGSWPSISEKANLRVMRNADSVRLLWRRSNSSIDEELTADRTIRVLAGESVQLACHVGGSNPAAAVSWLFRGTERLTVPGANGVHSNSNGRLESPQRRVFYKPFRGSTWVEKLEPVGKLWTVVAVLQIDSHSILDAHHNLQIECEAHVESFDETRRSPGTRLYVSVPPQVRVVLEPAPMDGGEFKEHDNVIATCSAVGRPDTFEYSWAIDDIGPLPDKTEARLPLALTRRHHDKLVRCWATNFARGEGSTRLLVRYGPKFAQALPQLYAASVGSAETLSCEADANPTPEIVWRRLGDSPGAVLGRGPTLRLASVRRRDFGQLACTATSGDFPPITRKIIVAENAPPRISTSVVQYAKMAHSHRLACRVNSIPLPSIDGIVWIRNGRRLVMDARVRIYREDFMGGTTAIVHFDEVFSTDYGAYNCTVSNGFGADSQVITLVMEDNIPVAFIAGASIALLMVLIFVMVLLCVCRKGYWETRAVLMREERKKEARIAAARMGSRKDKQQQHQCSQILDTDPDFTCDIGVGVGGAGGVGVDQALSSGQR